MDQVPAADTDTEAEAEVEVEVEVDASRDAAVVLSNLPQQSVDRTADRRIAAVLQDGLQSVTRDLPGVECAGRYLAADWGAAVGGDWYDLFPLPDRGIAVAVGDVMGHDMAAAAAMGQLRSVLRSYAFEGSSPAGVVDQLDRLAQGFDLALATLVYATLTLRPGGAELQFSNAGHPPPLVRSPRGQVAALTDGTSWLIGLPASGLGSRRGATAWLPAGSSLVLYTDGLVERHRQHLDEGLERLCDALAGPVPDASPDGLCNRIITAMAGDGFVDDLALLVVRIR